MGCKQDQRKLPNIERIIMDTNSINYYAEQENHDKSKSDRSVHQEEKSLSKYILSELKQKQDSCPISSLVSIWDQIPNKNNTKVENLVYKNPLKIEDSDENPWAVEDASVFLKYCCPECDFNHLDLQLFTEHAVEKHCKASTLFTLEKYETNSINDYKIKQQGECGKCRLECYCSSEQMDKEDKNIDTINIKEEPILKVKYESIIMKNEHGESKEEIKVDNKNKTQKCSYCVKEFSNKNGLSKHISSHDEIFNETKEFSKLKTIQTCAVQNCIYRCENGNGLKGLPDSHMYPEQRQAWINACKLTKVTKRTKICFRHFKFSDFQREIVDPNDILKVIHTIGLGPLKSQVVPSQYLPKSQNELEKNGKMIEYICKKCNKKFITQYKLKYHNVSVHSKHKMSQCQQCEKKFPTQTRLKKHMNSIHLKSKPYSCEKCGHSVIDKYHLEQHMMNKHTVNKEGIINAKKDVQCDLCGKNYSSHVLLKRHIENIHADKQLKCDQCDKLCSTKATLKIHTEDVHGIKDKKCPQCDLLFRSQHYVSCHVRIVHQKQFLCNQCGNSFGLKTGLETHIKYVHSDKKMFQCEKCSYKFDSKERLDHHFARKHKLRNCESCPHCGKQYSQLKSHIQYCKARWSDGDRPRIKCPNDCGKNFVNKVALREHIRKLRCQIKQTAISTED